MGNLLKVSERGEGTSMLMFHSEDFDEGIRGRDNRILESKILMVVIWLLRICRKGWVIMVSLFG